MLLFQPLSRPYLTLYVPPIYALTKVGGRSAAVAHLPALPSALCHLPPAPRMLPPPLPCFTALDVVFASPGLVPRMHVCRTRARGPCTRTTPRGTRRRSGAATATPSWCASPLTLSALPLQLLSPFSSALSRSFPPKCPLNTHPCDATQGPIGGGFYGPDCSKKNCPRGDDPLTGNGANTPANPVQVTPIYALSRPLSIRI